MGIRRFETRGASSYSRFIGAAPYEKGADVNAGKKYWRFACVEHAVGRYAEKAEYPDDAGKIAPPGIHISHPNV